MLASLMTMWLLFDFSLQSWRNLLTMFIRSHTRRHREDTWFCSLAEASWVGLLPSVKRTCCRQGKSRLGALLLSVARPLPNITARMQYSCTHILWHNRSGKACGEAIANTWLSFSSCCTRTEWCPIKLPQHLPCAHHVRVSRSSHRQLLTLLWCIYSYLRWGVPDFLTGRFCQGTAVYGPCRFVSSAACRLRLHKGLLQHAMSITISKEVATYFVISKNTAQEPQSRHSWTNSVSGLHVIRRWLDLRCNVLSSIVHLEWDRLIWESLPQPCLYFAFYSLPPHCVWQCILWQEHGRRWSCVQQIPARAIVISHNLGASIEKLPAVRQSCLQLSCWSQGMTHWRYRARTYSVHQLC